MRNHLPNTDHPKSPRRSNPYVFWPVWAMCAGLLLLLGLGIARMYLDERPHNSDVPLTVLGEDQDLHLDPRNLSPGRVHLFEARVSGQAEKFIVERTKDSVIHATLASCRSCYRSRSRHYVKDDIMICGECNTPMSFGSKGTKVARNSCLLIEIPHTETARNVTVLARDVIAQATNPIQR